MIVLKDLLSEDCYLRWPEELHDYSVEKESGACVVEERGGQIPIFKFFLEIGFFLQNLASEDL